MRTAFAFLGGNRRRANDIESQANETKTSKKFGRKVKPEMHDYLNIAKLPLNILDGGMGTRLIPSFATAHTGDQKGQ